MKLAFERSMRNSLYPVMFKRNRKSMNFKNESFKYYSSYEKNFNFGINHIMMINVVHEIIKILWYNKINGGIVPRNVNHPIIYEYSEKDLNEEKLNLRFEEYYTKTRQDKNMIISTSYEKIIKTFPFIGSTIIRTPKKMIDVFDQINHSKFNLDLNLRYFKSEDKNQRFMKFYTYDFNPTNLFTTSYNSITDKRQRHKNVLFEFDFNYFYAYTVLHGIRSLTLDYISEQIYTMNISESSKLFYIFFMVGKSKCKEPIPLLKIIDKLQLSSNSTKHSEKVVISILEELKENKIINSYKIIGDVILHKRIIINQEKCDFKY